MTNTSHALALLALVGSMGLAAHAADAPGTATNRRDAPSSMTADDHNNPEGKGLAKSAPARIGKADRSFMTKAAAASLYDIEVSRLASARATQPRIKSLAQSHLRDHTAALEGLQKVALNHNYPLPDRLPDDKRASIDQLAAMSSKEFDSAYRKQVGVKSAESAVDLFESGSRATMTPDLKAWIDATLPALRAQLKAGLDTRQD